MILAQVNPGSVKKSKDPKVIAGLLNDGRYCFPYLPEGDCAELREPVRMREQTEEKLIRIKNRVARWFAIYFPEYLDVYTDVYVKSGTEADTIASQGA